MRIFEQHPGVVESTGGDTCYVRYRELLIPAKLSAGMGEKPSAGSDVLFRWNRKGESAITKVVTGKIRFGVYACSPEESSFTAVFTDMEITECAWKAHGGQQPD